LEKGILLLFFLGNFLEIQLFPNFKIFPSPELKPTNQILNIEKISDFSSP